MMDYTKKPFYLKPEDLEWVEKTFSSMSQEEKLNQVFVDMLWNEPPKEVEAHQSGYQLGGFRYNNAGPEKLWEQNAAIQRVSKIPALIAANVEAGGNGAIQTEVLVGIDLGAACANTAFDTEFSAALTVTLRAIGTVHTVINGTLYADNVSCLLTAVQTGRNTIVTLAAFLAPAR